MALDRGGMATSLPTPLLHLLASSAFNSAMNIYSGRYNLAVSHDIATSPYQITFLGQTIYNPSLYHGS